MCYNDLSGQDVYGNPGLLNSVASKHKSKSCELDMPVV